MLTIWLITYWSKHCYCVIDFQTAIDFKQTQLTQISFPELGGAIDDTHEDQLWVLSAVVEGIWYYFHFPLFIEVINQVPMT